MLSASYSIQKPSDCACASTLSLDMCLYLVSCYCKEMREHVHDYDYLFRQKCFRCFPTHLLHSACNLDNFTLQRNRPRGVHPRDAMFSCTGLSGAFRVTLHFRSVLKT